MRSFFLSLSALCFLVLAGCAPTVNVATPEPVKIDVNMKVDVNYKEDPNKAKVDPLAQESLAQARRNRTGEVQTLKNDRVIGEARTGYLEIRNLPKEATYQAWAKSVVEAENADRAKLYAKNADQQAKPVELIQREYAQQWRDIAYPGELIQKDSGEWLGK
jgi:uncharacterized protein YdbL (DUF1318 family)